MKEEYLVLFAGIAFTGLMIMVAGTKPPVIPGEIVEKVVY